MEKPIYLDYNATTPLDPEVLEKMLPYLKEEFGNASSATHPYGWGAKAGVDKARKQVAHVINADPNEIYFTSGATESNNMALMGTLRDIVCGLESRGEKPHVVTSQVEHKAVLDVVRFLEKSGCETTFVPVDNEGTVHPESIEKALKPNTKLVSIMMANNEIGTINPIAEMGKMLRNKSILFHTDAAQAVGKIPVDVNHLHVDMLSISGHKIYGPKGVGALYVRKSGDGVDTKPIQFGGSQEEGLRPGTLNVAGIVGLGEACELCEKYMNKTTEKLLKMRDHIIDEVLTHVKGARLNGPTDHRLPNNVSFSFANFSSDLFTLGLSGLAVSSSSACSSSSGGGSYVLKAIGHDDPLAKATLRIGLGRPTTDSDIATAIAKIVAMGAKNEQLKT